jgi:pseudouridine kinase
VSAPAPARDRVICIGNATVDRTFALDGELQLGTKNPAVARPIAFGGVARNVAENLARLGLHVALIASVGDDDAGRAVLADARALGIDVGACVVTPDFPTPQYAAVLDPRNDLVFGCSDMRAIEALPFERVRAAASAPGTAWTFADCNLRRETLSAVIAAPRAAAHRLAIDAVSVAKAQRLPAALAGVDLLFCNVDEARAYLDAPAAAPDALAQALQRRGAQTTVMTLGAHGAIVLTPERSERVAAAPATVADVTGAGDALIAGTIYALAGGATAFEAVRTGMVAATFALEVAVPVNPALTAAALAERCA